MKNSILLVLTLALGQVIYAQKYFTKTGTINFEASVPSFEEVKAKSATTTAIYDTSNQNIAALVLVKSFRFKVALMEEHFNENYAESDKYPKAKFQGKVIATKGNQVQLKGTLNFHGVAKEIDVPATLDKNDGNYHLQSSFILKAEDYHIKIPKVVRKKIANDIHVDLDFTLQPKS